MRLTDLSPKWIDFEGRRGLGFLWRCSTGHCQGFNATLFANPLDGGPAWEGSSFELMEKLAAANLVDVGPDGLNRLIRGCGAFRWTRVEPLGESFETLSLTPSVNAYECGHWTATNGVCQ